MKYHPYAEVWPLLEGPKFDKLVADIKAHGLHYPITLYQDMILDGRNRFRACTAAGVTPRYEQSTAKDDKEALVISASLNEHRRHLSEDELALIAERLATLVSGQQARWSNNSGHAISNEIACVENPVLTIEEAAKLVGVSPARVRDARSIMKHAPDLKEMVLTKKMSMRGAATEARERAAAKKEAKANRSKNAGGGAVKQHGSMPKNAMLTRNDVDPEFEGDDAAFTIEYGHVLTMTSQKRSTMRFSDWTIIMGDLVRRLKSQQPPKITPTVLSWLRDAREADVAKMDTALLELDEAIDTARKLLHRARMITPDGKVVRIR